MRRFRNHSGELIHPIANPTDADSDSETALWLVRCDDRGDLCVYVWMWGESTAREVAEEYALKHKWSCKEADISPTEVTGRAERDTVFWHSVIALKDLEEWTRSLKLES